MMTEMMLMNQQICRCCLTEHPTISYNIFERENLRTDLLDCVPKLNIEPNDGLPDLICDLCWLRVLDTVDFKRKCEQSDRELRARYNEVNKLYGESNDFGDSLGQNVEILAVLEQSSVPDDNDNEALLYNATLELCELSPLEVSILNDVLLEDCNNASSTNFVREEDPVIIELLNSVLHDENDVQCTTKQKSLEPIAIESPTISDDQSAVITSTTTMSPTKRRRKLPKQPHICSECGKKFTRNFQLKLHLTSVHNIGDGLQYQCGVCQKTFASRHSLSYHHKSLHSEERDFACSQCDRRFVLRSQLASHERIHTGDFKPRIHECSKCGKTWPSKSDLRTHMRTHDPNVVRRFQCDQCAKKFFTRGHLTSHLLVHSGEKPFTCAICERSYQSVGNLNNHMVKRHSEMMLSRTRNRSGDPKTLIET